MQVLVTYGSERDGTAALARRVAQALELEGLRAVALPCCEAGGVLGAFDAVVVGGRLRRGAWPLRLRWFVWRRAARLRRLPVWFYSHDPAGASTDGHPAAPSAPVGALMGRSGARGHATFGHPTQERVRAWASEVARQLRLVEPS